MDNYNLEEKITEEEFLNETDEDTTNKDVINEEIQNWNEKPIPEEKLKKWMAFALVVVLSLLVIYAFIKVSLPESKNEKTNIKKEQEEDKSSTHQNKNMDNMMLDFDATSYKEYSKSKEKNSFDTNIPYETNKSSSDNSTIREKDIINVRNEENDILKELRSQQIKDEINARKSNLRFDNSVEKASSEKTQYIEERSEQPKQIAYPEDQNYQAQKKEFLKSDNAKDNYNKYSEQKIFSPYEVKAGSIIPGILLTGINSDLPGTILGTVREDVYDSVSGNYLLIPKGTKIKGTYDSGISYGQTRILVVWQRLIFPDGKSLNLDKFSGVDMSGFAGMTGKVNNHTYELFKAVVLSSVLGAGTSIISDKKNNDDDEDWKSSAGNGAGEQMLTIGSNISNKILGIQPTIEIAQGSRFNIIVESDLILSPYKRR